jgi:nucleotide-binding universal stress UspA family protein
MYKHIVVGTDGSNRASVAVDAAFELARLCGATVHVVHAYRPLSTVPAAGGVEFGVVPVDVVKTNADIREDGERLCRDAVGRANETGVRAETHCVPGDPADALIKVAQDTDADLLVLGNRGMEGVRRFVLGSVPNKVSHHAPCSLLIVRTT